MSNIDRQQIVPRYSLRTLLTIVGGLSLIFGVIGRDVLECNRGYQDESHVVDRVISLGGLASRVPVVDTWLVRLLPDTWRDNTSLGRIRERVRVVCLEKDLMQKALVSPDAVKDDHALFDGIGRLSYLEDVYLLHVSFPEGAISQICRAPRLKNVTIAGVSRGGLISEKDKRALCNANRIEALSIRNFEIGDSFVRGLCNYGSLRKLEITGFNRLTDECCADLKKLNGLRNLCITAPISDGGLGQLCEIQNLESMELMATYVTGRSFARVAELKNLKLFRVRSFSAIDSDHVLSLEKMRPDLKIEIVRSK